MKVRIDASKLQQMATKEIAKNLTTAGLYFVGKIRENLNTSQTYTKRTGRNGIYYHGHSPSLPGQFPKKLSGQLMKSITHTVDAEGLVLTVGTAQPHGKFLQLGTVNMSARPWLTLSWQKEKDAVTRIILN